MGGTGGERRRCQVDFTQPIEATTQEWALLTTLLERERRLCPPAKTPSPTSDTKAEGGVGQTERNTEAKWICAAARRLHYDGDVPALAIAIFDCLVRKTTVFVRYANCAAAASLFIASKLCEDFGGTFDASEFLSRLHLRSRYSNAELKRMELSILTKLDWDVMVPSAERFLTLLLTSIGGANYAPAIRLEVVLCSSHISCIFRPSVVALAVLSHLLEAQVPLTWLNTTHSLLRRCEIDGSELIACREQVSQLWAAVEAEQRASIVSLAAAGAARKRATRRKKRSAHAGVIWRIGGAPLQTRLSSSHLFQAGLCPEAKRPKSPWSMCADENGGEDLAEAIHALYQQP